MGNMINYNKNRNEVTINGCNDCPFFDDSYERTEIMGDCNRCLLYEEIEFCEDVIDINYFPDMCPLRHSNFKVVRNIK